MDALTQPLAELYKLGLPGVVIAALCVAVSFVAWAYWGQVRRNEVISEKRVEDAQKFLPIVEANTSSRERHTDAIERLAELIRNPPMRGRGR